MSRFVPVSTVYNLCASLSMSCCIQQITDSSCSDLIEELHPLMRDVMDRKHEVSPSIAASILSVITYRTARG